RDGAENADSERVVAARHEDRSHDGDRGDRVGNRHQRGVQQPRHAADDAQADERRQHEDVEGWPEIHGYARAFSRASRVRWCTTSPLWVINAPFWISSLRSTWKALSLVNA